MSADASGTARASCGDDGIVAIKQFEWRTARAGPGSAAWSGAVGLPHRTLHGGELATHTYLRPVLTVQVDPNYAKSATFAVGGLEGKCVINKKGWFSSSDVSIHEGEGPISTIKWGGTLLAWANDAGEQGVVCALALG